MTTPSGRIEMGQLKVLFSNGMTQSFPIFVDLGNNK